jgi:hypothetical protein
MGRIFSSFIRASLAAAIALQGCQAVSLKYHDKAGDHSALKVYPYWEDSDGEKYLVGGLKVTLYPRFKVSHDTFEANEIIEEYTKTDSHLYFDDLEPGSYRLRVFLNEQTQVSEKIELLPGTRLTVRIDVAGVAMQQQFMDTLDDIGETIGEAIVEIGAVGVRIAVEALKVYLFEDPDEEDEDR